jgi:hypothetical protein
MLMKDGERRKLTLGLLIGLAVLGCDWFEDPAGVNLPPDTALTGCVTDGVSEGDDVSLAWTGSDVDGDVAGFEYAYDGADWVWTAAQETTLQSVVQGSHLFQVRAVDGGGGVDPTPAECAFTVSAAGSPVPRVALVELFTTNTCPNCPKSEDALSTMLDEYGRRHLCVVAYHDKPQSDGLASAETASRIDWYTDQAGFPGSENVHPTAVFDGLRIVEGALTTGAAEADYRLELDNRYAAGSPLSISLTGSIGAASGSVAVVVRAEDEADTGSMVVRFVLVEDRVLYSGFFDNIYDYVARDILPDQDLDLDAVGDSTVIDMDFIVDSAWAPAEMDLIVFVQDTATREVVQAGRLNGD